MEKIQFAIEIFKMLPAHLVFALAVMGLFIFGVVKIVQIMANQNK